MGGEVEQARIMKARYDVTRYLHIRSAHSPVFSADDGKLVFISDITGVPQIWMVDLERGGWPDQLTFFNERIGFISHASNRDALVFGMDVGGNERFQLYIIEGNGESLRPLTNSPKVIHAFGDWSPDEKRITFSSNTRHQAFFDIYVQALDHSRAELIFQHDSNNYAAAWSPDGRTIIFDRALAPFRHELYRIDFPEKTVSRLTPKGQDSVYSYPAFDPSGDSLYCISDQGREFSGLARIDIESHGLEFLYQGKWDVENFALSKDGRRLALTLNEEGYSRLLIWELDSPSPSAVDTPSGVISGLKWSNTGSKLAFTLSTAKTNSDIWIYGIDEQRLSQVTFSSRAGIPEEAFTEPQLVKYKSFDGLEIPCFVFSPKTSSDVKPPLVVFVHGGPEGQFRPGFYPIIQYLVNRGLAVAAPNFRGSTGYGRTFTHLDDVYKRMDTVRDVERLVNFLKERQAVDPLRIGIWGASYGGFMVLSSLCTYPDIWSAGVDIVGIANFITFLNNTGPWRRKLRIAEYGDPEQDSDFLTRISPINNAHKIEAPLFVIHGVNDPRVPIGEAEQIVDTLRKMGRTVEYEKFEDEGHGLVKLKNRIVGHAAAVEFLVDHLSRKIG